MSEHNMNGNLSGMDDWVDFAKKQKAWAVEKTDRGDIPPTVIVERDGICAIVIAPQIDKHLGLKAAAMCQAGFDPDALTMVMDAHITQAQKKEGQTIEEAEEEFRKKFPPGSMQRMCDEEGACETGLITDCLICHRITRDGKISMVTLPYSYHGKGGPPFKWLDQDPKFGKLSESENPEAEVRGMIPDALRGIMKQPSFLDQIPKIKEIQDSFGDFSEERCRFHTARAMMSMLSSQDFIIADFTSGKHPEWTMAKENANEMLVQMVKDGFFPKEAFKPCKEIIDEHIGTAAFGEKMTALLQANGYWLPSDIRQDIESFVHDWSSICMSPTPPPPLQASKGDRVRVWNGNKSELLGEGKYVGEATIYIIQMPDGSIQSLKNAEVEPDDSEVPEGGVVHKVENNPKMLLDNGSYVYGCQVWWETIEEKTPHKHHAGCKHPKSDKHAKWKMN